MRRIVESQIKPVGHYSSAAMGGGLLFVSGQGPTVPATGKVVDGDFRAQARQCFDNIGAVLAVAGASWDDVVKTTAFIHDWGDFAALNEVYVERFPSSPPARSTVQGSRPFGHKLAIEAIAVARG